MRRLARRTSNLKLSSLLTIVTIVNPFGLNGILLINGFIHLTNIYGGHESFYSYIFHFSQSLPMRFAVLKSNANCVNYIFGNCMFHF